MDNWIVLIEWDGLQPPGSYYRRMEGLGFKVRGDEELGPLVRRSEGKGVIFQEGAVITASESVARTIGILALEEAKRYYGEELEGKDGRQHHMTVSIGRCDLLDHLQMTRSDAQVLDRINTAMGRRGPKPQTQIWTISCMECGQANEEETHTPLNCPHCGGLLIHARRGTTVAYADPGGDVFGAWLRTRFAGPHWEPTGVNGNGQMPPQLDVLDIGNEREREAAVLLQGAAVVGDIGQMGREVAFRFLDAIFINRAYRDRERRLENRLRVATEYFRRNGNPAQISLTEQHQPDLVDAAGAISSGEIVTWLFQFQGN